MRKAMTAADKGRPTGPMIGRVEDPVQGSPFSMLNNVREPLAPLTTITRRLEEVLELRVDFKCSAHWARDQEDRICTT